MRQISFILCMLAMLSIMVAATSIQNNKDTIIEGEDDVVYRVELYSGVCRGKPDEVLKVPQGQCITQYSLWICDGPTKFMNYSFSEEMVYACCCETNECKNIFMWKCWGDLYVALDSHPQL